MIGRSAKAVSWPWTLKEESVDDSTGRPVTMAQVAADAGVSIPTVSRVINTSAPVTDRTRQAVLQSIEDLDYHPNPMARGLSRGHSNTILVIVPHITEPSSTMRLDGLIGVLRRAPYELHVVCLERPLDERLRTIGEIVLQNRPAGVVAISVPTDEEDRRQFLASGASVVLVDSHSSALPNDTTDDVEGGELATRHLVALGHRRIGFIGDSEEKANGVPSSADRRHGFERVMIAAGLQVRPEYVLQAPHGADTTEELAHQMLDLVDPPTAIFASSDVRAFGVLAAARSAGLRVPHDLSVIGFDDVHVASLMGLTTIRQPLEISGRRAGIRLLGLLGHEAEEDLPEFPPLELVVRDTTAPLALTTQRSQFGASIEASNSVAQVPNGLDHASRQGQPVPRRK